MKRVFYNQVTGEKIVLHEVTDALAMWAVRHMDAWVELYPPVDFSKESEETL